MKWNEAQLSAINMRGKNILVSAAAGSGKTAVLTERIKRLIIDEGVEIDEMLIVTFTNAAAGEMRERIYRGISGAMEAGEGNLVFLQEQLDKLGSADICTFHAFCLKLIREYFYLTDLEPDFRICDEAQADIFAGEAMDILMKEFFEAENNESFLEFVKKYAKPGNEKSIADMIRGLYKYIRSMPDPFEWMNKEIDSFSGSSDEFEVLTADSGDVLRNLIIRYDQIYMEKKMGSNQPDFGDVEHMALKILSNPEPRSECRERYRFIFIDEYQDTNGVQEELIERIRRKDNVFMVGDVKQSIYQFRLADPQIFIDKYRKYRSGEDENGVKIDLNKNFRSKPAILDATNAVMKAIMTEKSSGIKYDEDSMLYSGIDYSEGEAGKYPEGPVELDIIAEKDIRDSAFHDEELRTLGYDRMKSAEIEALFVCRKIKEMLGKTYYDSKEGCIKKVGYNDIVVLKRSYRSEAQAYQRVFISEGIPAYIEGNDGYFESVEISVFVNLLRVILNMRQDIPLLSVLYSSIFDFSAEEFAIIRISEKKGLFADAFINYCESGEASELKEKCRKAFEKLRRWKDESHYISLERLMWKLATESGFYEYIQHLPLAGRRISNLKYLIDKAAEYQNNTSQGLVGFVSYLEQLELSGSGNNSVKSSGGGENESIVRLMSVHKSKGLEFPVVIASGLGKAFRHGKSSGELSMDRNLGIALRFRDIENGYYKKTEKQKLIDEEVKRKETAEEMRILYVAMTRAREKLILIGTVKSMGEELPGIEKEPEEAGTFLEWLCPPLDKIRAKSEDRVIINIYRSFSEKNENEENDGAHEITGEVNAKPLKISSLAPEKDFIYPFAEASKISAKYSATELNRIMNNKRPGEENEGESIPLIKTALSGGNEISGKMSPAERGIITHKVLQELDLSRADSAGRIEEQLNEMIDNGRLTRKEYSGIRINWLERFFRSNPGERLRSAAVVKREQPFLLWKQLDEDAGTLVQGIIDCYFEEEEGIVLIDYKTDYLPENADTKMLAAKAEEYRTQMEIYMRAIEESEGKEIKEAYLYFLSIGKAVRVQPGYSGLACARR